MPAKRKGFPADMDEQCIELCYAINKIPGLQTHESCCGHGERPFRVWFSVKKLSALPHLLYWLDSCHNKNVRYGEWRVVLTTDCAKSPVSFMLEGPVGTKAFTEALAIAVCILRDPDLKKS